MTNMKRVTISFPDELDRSICELREQDPFKAASYSNLVRYLIERGLAHMKESGANEGR